MFQDAYEQQQSSRRPSLASSLASTSSWSSQDEGSSSPATSRPSSLRFFSYLRPDQNTSSTSSSSTRTCEGLTSHETRELWRCMLELQQMYGCYNSTRIDLAITAGEAGIDLMPNPFIIDTLNSSLVDLPAQGWDMLDRRLRRDGRPTTTSKKNLIRKLWPRAA